MTSAENMDVSEEGGENFKSMFQMRLFSIRIREHSIQDPESIGKYDFIAPLANVQSRWVNGKVYRQVQVECIVSENLKTL